MKLAGLAAVFGIVIPSNSSAEVPKALVAKLRTTAAAAKFDGAILVGEPDGTSTSFAVGASPPATGAIWRWASITKQLAAVIAMQEVERGRLDLDAPVARYWPGWRAPYAKQIRIRDLLLHNSGLPQPDESAPDSDGVPGFYRSNASPPSVSAASFCGGIARSKPPAKYEYNNCDTLVLAEVLARITGKPFETLLRERLAVPLGMRSVGMFRVDTPARTQVQPTGEFSKEDAYLNLGVYGASGGAYGTIGDLWKFDRALLGRRLLSSASKERMWRSDLANGFYGFHQWIYPSPLKGCGRPVRIVERQGLVGGIELRNYLIPETGRALIMFSRHRPTNLGDPWEGKGFAFDMLSLVACG